MIVVDAEHRCAACSWPQPTGVVIPDRTSWDLDPATVEQLQRHSCLRLLGKFTGKRPEDLKLLNHATYLYLSRYPVPPLPLLSEFSGLEFLELDCDKRQTLEGLEKLRALRALKLTECAKLIDVSRLADRPELTVLEFILCNRVVDLSPVKSCRSLVRFAYEGKRLTDIDFLGAIPSLKVALLNATVTSGDLSPLFHTKLQVLLVKKRSFPKQDLARFRELQPQCELVFP